MYKGRLAGTLSDIGGYSFNYHKHIHTGEGGMIVTNDDDLCLKSQLLRNHAEAAVVNYKNPDLKNMLGHNFRLGEIECSIGIQQLKKLDNAILTRQKAANALTKLLLDFDGIVTPITRPDCTHTFYFYGMKINSNELGVSRNLFHRALQAEGVPFLSNCYQNLHLLPIFQEKTCYGTGGDPWKNFSDREYDYSKGICPIAERLNDEEFMGIFMCGSNYNDYEIDQIKNAFEKVYSNIDKLRNFK